MTPQERAEKIFWVSKESFETLEKDRDKLKAELEGWKAKYVVQRCCDLDDGFRDGRKHGFILGIKWSKSRDKWRATAGKLKAELDQYEHESWKSKAQRLAKLVMDKVAFKFTDPRGNFSELICLAQEISNDPAYDSLAGEGKET